MTSHYDRGTLKRGPNPKSPADAVRRRKQADRNIRIITTWILAHELGYFDAPTDNLVKAIANSVGCSSRTSYRDLAVASSLNNQFVPPKRKPNQ